VAKKTLYSTQGINADTLRSNIRAVYEVTAQADNAENLVAWYRIAREFCADVALDFGLTTAQVAGIVAVLSPQLSWERNKLTAVEFLRRYYSGQSFVGLMAYKANVDKALRIVAGECPETVVGGPKVTSFFNNILGNPESVTVDRHALHIALYGVDGASEKSGSITPTQKLYGIVADAYKSVAGEVGLLPSELQSLTWSFKAQNGEA
jgi:hypothetical protein